MSFEDTIFYHIGQEIKNNPEGRTLELNRDQLKGEDLDHVTAYVRGLVKRVTRVVEETETVHIHYTPKLGEIQNA